MDIWRGGDFVRLLQGETVFDLFPQVFTSTEGLKTQMKGREIIIVAKKKLVTSSLPNSDSNIRPFDWKSKSQLLTSEPQLNCEEISKTRWCIEGIKFLQML